MLEYFLLFAVLALLWLWADRDYWYTESKWILTVLVIIAFSLWNHFYNVTPEVHVERVRVEAQDNAPITIKTPLVDGCTIYYYYGYGRKENYTTKFVRCQNAETTTELKYSCGTSKSTRTCTDQIITKDSGENK